MLESIAIIIFVSLILASLAKRIHIPPLIFMMITGVILGPYALDLIDGNILLISADLRQIALIVILLRAGLTLDLEDLKAVGRPALLLSFIPALMEIGILGIMGHILFDLDYARAFLLGSMVAAVSPAVIVPSMIHLIEKKIGTDKKIPQMILAAASIDDVVVIVIFGSMLLLVGGQTPNIPMALGIPLAVILGAIFGIIIGKFLVIFFRKFHMRDTVKIMILFAFAFSMIYIQDILEEFIFISGLIAIMTLGMTIQNDHQVLSFRLREKFSKLWVISEIMLFVLVGALLDIRVIGEVGLYAVIFIIIGVTARMIGSWISTIKTTLNAKERLFTMFSYSPKATVQAAIGGIPLMMGIAFGEEMLVIAVLSIFMTAPIGAILIDQLSKKFLNQ